MNGLIRPVDICLPESGGRVERRAGERGGHFITLQTTTGIDFLITPRTEVVSSYTLVYQSFITVAICYIWVVDVHKLKSILRL